VQHRCAFGLIERLMVVAIIAFLVRLLIPEVQQSGEAARRRFQGEPITFGEGNGLKAGTGTKVACFDDPDGTHLELVQLVGPFQRKSLGAVGSNGRDRSPEHTCFPAFCRLLDRSH
jgi:hypothetical protein